MKTILFCLIALKFKFMINFNSKYVKLAVEIIKAVAYVLAGYFGGDIL